MFLENNRSDSTYIDDKKPGSESTYSVINAVMSYSKLNFVTNVNKNGRYFSDNFKRLTFLCVKYDAMMRIL